MNAALKQLRKGFQDDINISKVLITLKRSPMTTDPITGDQVRDPEGVKTEHENYGRITHERSNPPHNRETPAGLSTNLNRMLMNDWLNMPYEFDVFDWEGKTWEVGPVDPIIKFGGVVGYQSPLKEANEIT